MISDRLRQWLWRAFNRRGYERETAYVIAKCVIASSGAWALGSLLVSSPQVSFAPFSALLVVRPSVYGSVLQTGRYIAAVFLGALLAGLVGITVGVHLWIFALAVLAALVLGQATLFGEQGRQVPVVAAFVLAGGTASDAEMLGELLLMVLVGSLVALATNVLLAPAIRFRDAENAVLDFADGMRYLVQQMADGLREGREGLDTDHWVRVASGFDSTVKNARAAVERQEYHARLNPRRIRERGRPPVPLRGYRAWISALGRASSHLQSITRTLRSTEYGQARLPAPHEDFLRDYARMMDSVADVLRTLYDEEEPERVVLSPTLRERLERAMAEVDQCQERLEERSNGRTWPVHGTLLLDVERLLEELEGGRESSEQEGGAPAGG